MAQRAVDASTPLRDLLGPPTGDKLRDKLGLHTAGDLLRYYPRRYDRVGRLTDLAGLQVGERVVVQATVAQISTRRPRQPARVRSITEIVIGDGRRTITCSAFNQEYLTRRLPPGTAALFAGTVSTFNRQLRISSPQITLLDGDRSQRELDVVEMFASGIIPIYPLVDGITLGKLQLAIGTLLRMLPEIDDPVPTQLLAGRGLLGLDPALRHVHRPPDETSLGQARARLRYDEALAIQLVLARRRATASQRPSRAFPPVPDGVLAAFDAALPFELTAGQRTVGAEIEHDLDGVHPMNRLLQGEVGSGKTVVALRAMLQVTDGGAQAVLLAPTEVLAAQHFRSLSGLLGSLGRGGQLDAADSAVSITLLTGSMGARERRGALAAMAGGAAGIAVGTHALLSDPVVFDRLGLVVVDEQHRFGVQQRDTLRSRNAQAPPHMLVMTATPIPRTVAMTVYGDLETSTLRELPRGRSPIATTVVPTADRPQWLDRAWERVREEVGAGHQVYVVCPKIGDGSGAAAGEEGFDAEAGLDADGLEDQGRRPPLAVLDVADELRSGPLSGLRLAVVHGRLPPGEKDDTMVAFTAGLVDVLVATTVIEVGVDVPNATMMVIMDADRFGISQLHQLRGRVGRGRSPGVCLLVTAAPADAPAMTRLSAVASTGDGFELAEADLALRREGDVLGTSQAGRLSGLRQLSLLEHRDVIETARDDARDLVAHDPDLSHHPGLAQLVGSVIDSADEEFLEKA